MKILKHNMLRNTCLVMLCCLHGLTELRAQDIHFSQIQEAPLWLNPANAGFYNGYLRAVANYRNQWASMGNAFQTMSFSFDAVTMKRRNKPAYLGVGMYVFNDKAGAAKLSTTQAQLHVSGVVRVGKGSRMSAGIYGGFSQNNANYNALTYGSQYAGGKLDNTLASGETVNYTSFFNTDMGAGLNYEYSNKSIDLTRDDEFSLKIGAAVHHLAQPVQRFSSGSTYQLPMRFVGQISSRIDIKGSAISILPSIIYLRQASASEINLGTQVRYRFKNGTKITGNKSEAGLSLGAYYRIGDAVIPQLMMDIGNYALGFSFDYNVSRYKQVSRGMGGMEIYLKFMNLSDALFKRHREHGL
ncbi:MAG: PorP/SprF family type IX secretion system membrane protein [Bacteroidetes bacterium]|nr:PorP/SprF family type IX secretion system membrane protein [Bacteroidota bacterium]